MNAFLTLLDIEQQKPAVMRAWIAVAMAFVYLGMFLLSKALQADSNQAKGQPIKDEKPPTSVTSGTYIPYLIGRRRIGPVVAWVGDRKVKKVPAGGPGGAGGGGGGGKGGGGAPGGAPPVPMISVYYESAWHVICVGPTRRLYKIYNDGKALFEGPIDQTSHPSGTNIDLGDAGNFDIYWGQPDQPINTWLGDEHKPKGPGINSRWPYVCYILWHDKKLGQSPRWGSLEYEFEAQPENTAIAGTRAWIPESYENTSGKHFTIIDGNGGDPYGGFLPWCEVSGNKKKHFKSGNFALLESAGPPDGNYEIDHSEWIASAKKTRIYFFDTLSIGSSGTISPLTKVDESGANPAHAIEQLLFSPYPLGLHQSREEFNMKSFETFAQLCAETGEGLPLSVWTLDGEDVETVLAGIMQDMGIFFSLKNGLYEIVSIRRPQGAVPVLPAEVILDPKPEIETVLEERKINRIQYEFADVKKRFRTSTVTVDDDGQAGIRDNKSVARVKLPTCIHRRVAHRLGERRSQEDLSNLGRVRVIANHEARFVYPGMQFIAGDYPHVLVATEVDITNKQLSSEVQIETLTDSYMTDVAEFLDDDDPDDEQGDPQADEQFDVLEVPQYFEGYRGKVGLLRCRSSDVDESSSWWIAKDGVNFKHFLKNDDAIMTGGVLEDELPANTSVLLEEGPTFTVLGPDIDTVQDLSGDNEAWRAGDQVCVIISSAGTEIFFLQSITALGDNLYRLNNLLRSRYGGYRYTHPVGAKVFIFNSENISIGNDRWVKPLKRVYFKSTPVAEQGVPLQDVLAVPLDVVGKNKAPLNPLNLRIRRTDANGNVIYNCHPKSYEEVPEGTPPDEHDDIPFYWSYRSYAEPATGAGMQPFGQPTEQSPIQGSFTLRIRADMGSAPVRKVHKLKTNSWTYKYNKLKDDFGGIVPDSFVVEVLNVKSGLKSDSVFLTVNKLA